MIGPGFQEEQAGYTIDPQSLVGSYRRFGPDGPAYEILEVNQDGTVLIEILYNSDRSKQTLAEVLADPIAATLP